MDWVPSSDPFVWSKRVDEFDCEDSDPNRPVLSKDTSQRCQVIQRYDGTGSHPAVADLTPLVLSGDPEWNGWTSSAVFSGLATQMALHNGFCILFIPRAAGSQLQGQVDPSGFTELPITKARWNTIAEAFYLPGHFCKAASRRLLSIISVQRACTISSAVENVWMHTATTDPGDGHEHGFALAATHIESRCFTYAVMVGCSMEQIRKVKKLVNEWEDGTKHPLFMLGMCAELYLDRLEALVKKHTKKYNALMQELDGTRGAGQFRWDTIKKVQEVREESKRIEEEVNTTRLQLSKACLSGVRRLLEQYNPTPQTPTPQTPTPQMPTPQMPTPQMPTPQMPTPQMPTPQMPTPQMPTPKTSTLAAPVPAVPVVPNNDAAIEVTTFFDERFQDILSRLEGLGAKCRIGVEGISFSTDVIRSELARQEAGTSADNTAYGTAFALMAAIYLPTTAVATIFAMPIFGWTNDWRDWHYSSLQNSSNDSSSASTDQSNPPVVSGYVWIWLAFSVGLSILTFSIFYFCVYRKLHSTNRGKEVGAGV